MNSNAVWYICVDLVVKLNSVWTASMQFLIPYSKKKNLCFIKAFPWIHAYPWERIGMLSHIYICVCVCSLVVLMSY